MINKKQNEKTIAPSTVMTVLYGTGEMYAAKAVSKVMMKRLNKSLQSSNGKNTTTLYRGVFFQDGTSVFIGLAFGNVDKAPTFSFVAPNMESITRTRIGNTPSKKMMRKFLMDNLDASDDEVMCIVTTSSSMDGELEVKGIFAGDLNGYRLCQVDIDEVKFSYERCNHIDTTSEKEVA